MSMNRTRLSFAVLGAAFLSVTLAGHAPSPQGQRQKPGQAQEQAAPVPRGPISVPQVVPPQPTPPALFRSGVEMVTTDVITRDSGGQFVSDLKPDEFDVYEDGVKQDVVQLLLFHGGRQYSPLAAPVQVQREGIILPPPRPTNDAAGRIFVFFLDDLHLDFRESGRTKELIKKIRQELVHEGDMFCIVSTGPSSIAIDMTYNPKRLDEAMSRISGDGLSPNEIVEGGTGAEGPAEVRYRAHVAFSTAYDLLDQLEQIHNRRKAFIYISNGYDFNPFATSVANAMAERENPGSTGQSTTPTGQAYTSATDDPTSLFNQQGAEFADADLARELSELTRAANRANVTFYTIDPRGLVGMLDMDQNVDQTEWQDYVRKSQDSLQVIAHETGGIAVINSNDFSKALKRIDAETSDYYVIGYYSGNPDPIHRNRRVDVKVTRKGVTVWARPGYSLKSSKKK
jgi:VWFA-related protein